MVNYTCEDLKKLQDVVEDLTGKGYEGDLMAIILGFMGDPSRDLDCAIKLGVSEYLCSFPEYILFKTYRKMGIEDILFNLPLEAMPLYISYGGEDLLKRIAATWRIQLGK